MILLPIACSDIPVKANGLIKAMEEMCVTANQVTWTSVSMTTIGGSDLTEAGTENYTIPDVIPSNAREVLIYVVVNSGYSSRGTYNNIKISTQIESNSYEQYIRLDSWDQSAINTNSDNMWFPMPPNRRVYLTVSTAYRSNAGAQIYVIGYR